MKNLNLNVRRIILKVMRNCYLGQKIEELYRPFLVYKRLCADIKIHSQFGQDLLACLYFNKKKDGFFVDIGANSGLIGSNTYALEKLGWEGVCIEPQPDIFVQLKKNRKCACYNVALSSQAGDVNFFKVHGLANELSGLNDDMSEERKNEAKRLGRTEIIRVKTMTFDAIMQDFPNRKHIDFMSIDVEGHEVQILKSIDFVNYSFGLITIEKSEPKEIVAIMEQNGYKYLMDLGADIMFAPLQSKLPPPPPTTVKLYMLASCSLRIDILENSGFAVFNIDVERGSFSFNDDGLVERWHCIAIRNKILFRTNHEKNTSHI